jgi:Ca2+-binding EF-hand superfamily protein
VGEIREIFDTMGTRKDLNLWEDIMNEVDLDGDRLISFEEFKKAMLLNLERKNSAKME